MANFAPPICRDGFVYHGQLFADVGNLNRHPRASIQDLNDLLRPNKPAKDGQSKDRVGHWYFAQLRHYGLPTTKDKNAAKVRLLNALNGGKLEVPKDVKKLESQLKKEYDAANKKAKAELKGEASTSVSRSTKATPSANKRKRNDDEAVATKAPAKKKAASTPTPATSTINVGRNGDISINIAYQEFLGIGDSCKQSTPKKAATKKTSATAQCTTSKATTQKKKATPKTTASARTTSADVAGPAKKSAAKGTAASKSKATPKDQTSLPAKSKGGNKKDAAPGPKTAQTARRTPGVIKQEGDYFHASGASTPFDSGISRHYNHNPDLVQITGIYDVRCSIEDDYPAHCENGCSMMLCYEISAGRLWGSFAFGPFFGVIQLNPGPAYLSHHSLSLGWRAKDLERDMVRSGRGCTGNMVCERRGEISGRLFDLFDNVVEFYGTKRDGPPNCGFAPSQFEEEWASYVDNAYCRKEDGELYDEDGNLQPSGRYEQLMRESLGAW